MFVGRTSWSLAPVVLGAALLVAGLSACTGAAASPPVPTAPPPSTTAATDATGTTSSTSTVAPATTTTVATTTVAPTTTPLDVEAKVAADFYATEAAFYACTAAPDHCDLTTIAIPDTQTFANLERFMGKLAQADWRETAGPDGYLVIEGIVVAPNGRTAVVRGCSWDTGRIFDPAGTSEPSDDILVEDLRASTRATVELHITDQGWRRATVTIDDKVFGENTCPPPGS
jgi:hypothetical protein